MVAVVLIFAIFPIITRMSLVVVIVTRLSRTRTAAVIGCAGMVILVARLVIAAVASSSSSSRYLLILCCGQMVALGRRPPL
jgi:hypothetical protein